MKTDEEFESALEKLGYWETKAVSRQLKIEDLEKEIIKLKDQFAIAMQTANKEIEQTQNLFNETRKRLVERTEENLRLTELVEAYKKIGGQINPIDIRELKRGLRNRLFAAVEEVFKGE